MKVEQFKAVVVVVVASWSGLNHWTFLTPPPPPPPSLLSFFHSFSSSSVGQSRAEWSGVERSRQGGPSDPIRREEAQQNKTEQSRATRDVHTHTLTHAPAPKREGWSRGGRVEGGERMFNCVSSSLIPILYKSLTCIALSLSLEEEEEEEEEEEMRPCPVWKYISPLLYSFFFFFFFFFQETSSNFVLCLWGRFEFHPPPIASVAVAVVVIVNSEEAASSASLFF